MWGNQMKLALVTVVVALVVIQLGALTRLKDAGLGCPDWPGCYGHWRVNPQHHALQSDEAVSKAHFEMNHRYIAGTLGALIVLLAVSLWRRRWQYSLHLPLALVGLVVFQALLGMWTVTLRLHPLVVSAHLIGGYLIFSGLTMVAMRQWQGGRSYATARYHLTPAWFYAAMVLITLQVLLGVWVSANYAAFACLELPACTAHYDLAAAFQLWGFAHVDFEFGVFALEHRVTQQMVHRIGAVLVLLYFCLLAYRLWRSRDRRLRGSALWLIGLVVLQVGLGLANIIGHLPIWSAMAHNLVAAMLFCSTFVLYDAIYRGRYL